jgi:hypothetical protein
MTGHFLASSALMAVKSSWPVGTSSSEPNYEFFSPTAQFLSENRRLPIFGFRLEF